MGVGKDLNKYVMEMVSTPPRMDDQRFKDFIALRSNLQKDCDVTISRGEKPNQSFIIGKPAKVEEAKLSLLQFLDPKANQVSAEIEL